MIKVYALAALITLTNFATWQVCNWKHDAEDKKVIVDKVENHNEDLISLEEHTKQVESLAKAYETQLDSIEPIRLPPVTIYATADLDSCLALIDEHERMHNEAAGIANSVSFEDAGS